MTSPNGGLAQRSPVLLRAIAVDLTPVLPGGENGGAKPFALALVRRLAALCPGTQLVLLTQAASHEELAVLDAPNVRRVMAVGAAAAGARSGLFAVASRAVAFLPDGARRAAARAGYAAQERMKRAGAQAALRGAGWDLLFCPFTAPTLRAAGVPTVCTVYDVQFHDHAGFFTPEDAEQRRRAFDDACRHATLLAAISDFTRARAIELAGLAPERIATIALRLPQPTGAEPSPARAQLGLAAGGYLLYPANFWKHKNHGALLEAFAIACREGLPAGMRLVCTGAGGVGRSAAMKAAASLGIADRVVLPGFVPEADLAALMRDCRGVVFPSLYEGFGLPVVEAMALGVPVACSRIAALPEVAGEAALFFDPRSAADIARAMVSLATDEALRARLVAAGRERAVPFADTDRMAREYLDLFQRAAASHG